MGYDNKGIRVPDLEEAGFYLGLARGGVGSWGACLGSYYSWSDIFGIERPGSPGKTQTDKGGEVGAKMSGRGVGGAPQGLRSGPSRSHHRSQTPVCCIL